MSPNPKPTPPAEAPDRNADLGELFPPPAHPAAAVRRAFMGTLGVLCIVVGIVLGILPIVPGFPLIAVGVILLVGSSEPSRRFVNRSERWLPRSMRRMLRRIARTCSFGR